MAALEHLLRRWAQDVLVSFLTSSATNQLHKNSRGRADKNPQHGWSAAAAANCRSRASGSPTLRPADQPDSLSLPAEQPNLSHCIASRPMKPSTALQCSAKQTRNLPICKRPSAQPSLSQPQFLASSRNATCPLIPAQHPGCLPQCPAEMSHNQSAPSLTVPHPTLLSYWTRLNAKEI